MDDLWPRQYHQATTAWKATWSTMSTPGVVPTTVRMLQELSQEPHDMVAHGGDLVATSSMQSKTTSPLQKTSSSFYSQPMVAATSSRSRVRLRGAQPS